MFYCSKMEYENVTIRQNKNTININDSLDLSFGSTHSEIRSLPNLSTGYDSDKEELKEEICKLNQELLSAHAEIEKLIEENQILKNSLDKQKSKSKSLQKICSHSSNTRTSTLRNKKKTLKKLNLSLSNDEVHNTSCIDLGLVETTSGTTPDDATSNRAKLKQSTSHQGTDDDVEVPRHNNVRNVVNNSSAETPLNRKNGDSVFGLDSSQCGPKSVRDLSTSLLNQNYRYKKLTTACNKSALTGKTEENSSLVRKLCIISSNNKNKILQIAENTINNFQICHYIYPHSNVIKLMENIGTKINKFTCNDYCVVIIGEEDFTKTRNYYDIIAQMKIILKTIKHTNVIIALPTYRHSEYSVLYNSRIEAFNSMIYYDTELNKYATLLDSNLNLTCDYTMFSKYKGVLNNNGMKNIFQNLKLLLEKNVCVDKNMNNQQIPENRFFRA